jgi:hypothetical protein
LRSRIAAPEEGSALSPAILLDEEFNRRFNEMIRLPEPETEANHDTDEGTYFT